MTSGGWNRQSEEEIEKIVLEKEFRLISLNRGFHSAKIEIQDNNGYKYYISLSSFKKRNPEKFNKKNPFTLENISLWLKLNNKEFVLFGYNLYNGNDIKLNFICLNKKCGEKFQKDLDHIIRGQGCPFCGKTNKKVSSKNNLGALFPNLEKEWDYNKNELSSFDFVYATNKKVFWICSVCNYEWISTISSRTTMNSGCPNCAGKVVNDSNRFSTNYPEISLEWHPTKNGVLTPNDVSYGTNKKVWWLCPNGHEYFVPVDRRTSMETGCPKCKESKGEKKIRRFLLKNNFVEGVDFISQKKFENCKNLLELPFDFYLSNYNLAIEYHGEQHYIVFKTGFFGDENDLNNRQMRDKIKEKYCQENGIGLLIIPYWEFDNIENILEEVLLGG